MFKKLLLKYSKLIATLNLKPKELVLKDKSCLCLCPHADDETIGMGGLLSLYPENFEVTLLTDGRKGVKDLDTDEVIKLREEEFSNAMKIANITKFSFLKYQDKKLLKKSFNMDISKYDYIFLPNIIDQHPDHKAVSILLNELLQNTKYKNNLQICFYEVWSALGFVNAYVDISEVIETKKNMLNCYKSQIATKDYVYYASGLNQYRGMFKDKKFVEAFCVMDVKEFSKICELY